MNSNALLDAKTQYQHLLRHRLADVVYDAFLNMYTQAEQLNVGETLVAFQTIVKDVQNWNMRTVEDTVARTETACGPRFITQCLKAIFYLNAKILSGFEDGRCKEIQLCVPPVKDFVYNVFLETARTLYRNPTLLITDTHQLSSEQIEKNVEAVYTAIFRAIDRVVDKTFPYEDFLRSFDEDPSPPPPPPESKDDDDVEDDDEFANNTNDDDDDDDEVNAMRHIPLGSVGTTPPPLHGGGCGGDGTPAVTDGARSPSGQDEGVNTTTTTSSRPAMLYSDAEEEEDDDQSDGD